MRFHFSSVIVLVACGVYGMGPGQHTTRKPGAKRVPTQRWPAAARVDEQYANFAAVCAERTLGKRPAIAVPRDTGSSSRPSSRAVIAIASGAALRAGSNLAGAPLRMPGCASD